ncbi:MAG: arylesterase [Desulfobacteraceae bacterium]|nr:arylesterase [Desulfobacteraceae bacterium]
MVKKTAIAVAVCLALFAAYRFLTAGYPIVNADPKGERLVAFGDSLTHGTGAAEGMDYPSQLSRMIGEPIINAGVPGDTTSSALQRLQRDVLDHDPRIVFMTLGGNDLKNRVDKATAFRNLERIIREIQATGALVVLGGIRFPVYDRGFSEAYRSLAERTGTVLIPNIYKDIMGDPKQMSDPIHPNGVGYRRMAEYFFEAVQPYL